MKMPLAYRASILALAATLGSTPALAADQPSDQTVVVTAQSTTPFDESAGLDKLGATLFDNSRSIQIVPRELIDQQGGVQLKDTLRNVSGLVQGGQYAFGFYDRFVSRGLNVTFLNDGLPDTTSDLGGYVHSLTGVERVEVLKGPGSALFGTSAPGGTINLVHYRPTDRAAASASLQYGSFDKITANGSLNGALGGGVNARVDGQFQRSDGYRGTRNRSGEVSGTLAFHPANHDILARFEYHRIEVHPDAIGIPFALPAAGSTRVDPLNVSLDNRYYTPFAFADQSIKRAFLSDAWTVNDSLVVNLRTAYTDRDVDLARNAGGRLTGTALTGRQLRQQQDNIHDFVFQAEPTWKFSAGSMPVTLLAGFEYRNVSATTRRSTADLPNIANVYSPVIPETSLAALNFQCDKAHSCNDAKVDGRFYGLYATAQVDITPRLKLRLSGRQDWFNTSAEGRSVIPTNPGSEHPCDPPTTATTCPFVPDQPVVRNDDRFEWDVGAVYQLADSFALFGGYANNSYPIFNTEEPQSIGQVPEKGTQVEAGLRFRQGNWLSLSTSLFRTTRKNVYVIVLNESEVYSYRVKGWESDLSLRPVPAWNINANFTLQDAVLTDYPQNMTQIGNRVPSVPKRIGNVWTSYDIALPDKIGTFQLAAGLRYRSDYFGDTAQTRLLPGATMVDLTAAVLNGPWTIRGGVRNIGDARNFDYAAGVGSGAIPGPGRTFFLSLALKTL
ncbi:MAG: TonB-dependent receptor [Sphingomonadales bacterium]|nr:TonB-dependent receptor [Sphingomonadales bacterium]